jgi:hypothetical protein
MSPPEIPNLSATLEIIKWKDWWIDPVPDYFRIDEAVQKKILVAKIEYMSEAVQLQTEIATKIIELQGTLTNQMSDLTRKYNERVGQMIGR